MQYSFVKQADIHPSTFSDLTSNPCKIPNTMGIQVHFQNPEFNPIEADNSGNWIDLRAAEEVYYKKSDHFKVSLGMSMKIPAGYEVHLVVRSSDFDRYGVIQTNAPGIIDESFSGTNDIWKISFLALREDHIPAGARIAQFRLVKSMSAELFPIESNHVNVGEPCIVFIICDELDAKDRGGFGSTGA